MDRAGFESCVSAHLARCPASWTIGPSLVQLGENKFVLGKVFHPRGLVLYIVIQEAVVRPCKVAVSMISLSELTTPLEI